MFGGTEINGYTTADNPYVTTANPNGDDWTLKSYGWNAVLNKQATANNEFDFTSIEFENDLNENWMVHCLSCIG